MTELARLVVDRPVHGLANSMLVDSPSRLDYDIFEKRGTYAGKVVV